MSGRKTLDEEQVRGPLNELIAWRATDGDGQRWPTQATQLRLHNVVRNLRASLKNQTLSEGSMGICREVLFEAGLVEEITASTNQLLAALSQDAEAFQSHRARTQWQSYYDATVAYASYHGHLPAQHTEVGNLGQWLHRQMTPNVDLGEERGKLIRQLVAKYPSKAAFTWDEMYEEAAAYLSDNGGLYPPRRGPAEQLYWWLRAQKDWYLDRRHKRFTSEEQIRYDRIQVLLSPEAREDAWNAMFVQVSKYIETTGSVPYDPLMATWVKRHVYDDSALLPGKQDMIFDLLDAPICSAKERWIATLKSLRAFVCLLYTSPSPRDS